MKDLIISLLINRTKAFLARTNPIVVAITGSVGKTSTTQAVAKLLSEKYSVKSTFANYNTDLGVILTIFNQKIQTNPFSWMFVIIKIIILSFSKSKYEVYVLELGTDAPGDIEKFAYLRPQFSIVTAIAPEHMEFFKELSKVAEEELSVTRFSAKTVLGEDVKHEWIEKYASGEVVKTGQGTNIKVKSLTKNDLKSMVTIILNDQTIAFESTHIADHLIKGLVAPAFVAHELNLNINEIKTGLEKIQPLAGRMQVLKGLNNSIIIDDTYNASPEAVKRALDVLYNFPAKTKIAVLGMMNELGDVSRQLHEEVGEYCDSNKLKLLITLGDHANKYLAPTAKANGCQVIEIDSPLEVFDHVKNLLSEDTVILLKGSQSSIYLEEAIKDLLINKSDISKLVRQVGYWPHKKQNFFNDVERN